MGKDGPQLVIANAANKSSPTTQLGDAGQGIGSRTTGGLQARANAGVEQISLPLIHQGHAALVEAMLLQKALIGLHQYIDDGVADADDIKALLSWAGHEGGGRSRLLSQAATSGGWQMALRR